jgi:flagellar biosynthesis anti-sigma factor FlgM
MSVISQIHSSVYNAAYEPKLQNAKESGNKKDDIIKDSVALSNKVSAKSSNDKSISVLKKLVESQADVRMDKVSAIKTQIENGTYTIDDKIDAISDDVINSMLA